MNTKRIDVHLLPDLLGQVDLKGTVAAVIDVLRATTTITHAVASGVRCVVPCLTIEEARDRSSKLPGSLLGGERGGQKIPGFDLGNSPMEYDRATVEGKTLFFTTTNGTKAMQACRTADQVLVAAFVNLSAVCRELAQHAHVHLICAGTNGEITREDVLLAGAIVDQLGVDASSDLQCNDQAQIAADAWQVAKTGLTSMGLAQRLRLSRGGRNVLQIGLEDDIDIAATLDKFDLVPQLDTEAWEIKALPGPTDI